MKNSLRKWLLMCFMPAFSYASPAPEMQLVATQMVLNQYSFKEVSGARFLKGEGAWQQTYPLLNIDSSTPSAQLALQTLPETISSQNNMQSTSFGTTFAVYENQSQKVMGYCYLALYAFSGERKKIAEPETNGLDILDPALNQGFYDAWCTVPNLGFNIAPLTAGVSIYRGNPQVKFEWDVKTIGSEQKPKAYEVSDIRMDVRFEPGVNDTLTLWLLPMNYYYLKPKVIYQYGAVDVMSELLANQQAIMRRTTENKDWTLTIPKRISMLFYQYKDKYCLQHIEGENLTPITPKENPLTGLTLDCSGLEGSAGVYQIMVE